MAEGGNGLPRHSRRGVVRQVSERRGPDRAVGEARHDLQLSSIASMTRRSVLTPMSAHCSILETDPRVICKVCAISACDRCIARRTSLRPISSPGRRAATPAAARASRLMRARSSAWDLLPATFVLLLQLGQARIIERIGHRDHPVGESRIARLVAANQQDGCPARVKSGSHAQRLASCLRSEPATPGNAKRGRAGPPPLPRLLVRYGSPAQQAAPDSPPRLLDSPTRTA